MRARATIWRTEVPEVHAAADERADARPHDERRSQPAFFEGAEDADVGQPFEAATAQNQCKRTFFVHVLPRLQLGAYSRSEIKIARIVRRLN